MNPHARPAPAPLTADWSRDLHGGARGLSLAREARLVLTWDDAGWLTLLDHAGRPQAQRPFAELLMGAAADDGSAFAAASKDGAVWWLAPDLSVRRESRLTHTPTALTLDSYGQYLAVSDAHGGGRILDRHGRTESTFQTPRPLSFLSFVPTVSTLIGCADFGLVAGFNLKGETLWVDGLVVSVGGLAVDGAGEQILLACFSEGLHRYHHTGKRLDKLATPEPARLVGQSFDGSRIVVANMTNAVTVMDRAGQVLIRHEAAKNIQALAVGPLGKELYLALAKGPVLRLTLTGC
jgi:hypothetical protein